MKETNTGLKIAAAVLGLVAVILLVLLINSRKQAADQVQTVSTLSNQVQQATVELTDHKQTITNLEAELNIRQADIVTLSNTLTTALTNLDQAQNSMKVAQDELVRRNEAFAKLEVHSQALETRTAELDARIASLNSRIEEITQKLTAAEGDKAALGAELKRLSAEKEELESKFNDLKSLKAQVKKIRSEQAIARRLEWQRAGVQTAEPKGAEKMTGTGAAAPAAARQGNYDLNVEVNADGSLKVIPPLKK